MVTLMAMAGWPHVEMIKHIRHEWHDKPISLSTLYRYFQKELDTAEGQMMASVQRNVISRAIGSEDREPDWRAIELVMRQRAYKQKYGGWRDEPSRSAHLVGVSGIPANASFDDPDKTPGVTMNIKFLEGRPEDKPSDDMLYGRDASNPPEHEPDTVTPKSGYPKPTDVNVTPDPVNAGVNDEPDPVNALDPDPVNAPARRVRPVFSGRPDPANSGMSDTPPGRRRHWMS
jgi:hypothetical protein